MTSLVHRAAQPFCPPPVLVEVMPLIEHMRWGEGEGGGQGNPPPPPQHNMHPSYWDLFSLSPLEGRIDFDKALHTGIMLLSRPNLSHI